MLGRPAVAIPPVPGHVLLRPPMEWINAAAYGDVMTVSGRHIYYFGKPRGAANDAGSYYKRVHYSGDSTHAKPFKSVILHYTRSRPELDQDYYATILTRIQHEGSKERRGSLGYHFYVTTDGAILQGAPLSSRTNHIMPRGSSVRSKDILPDADNDDAIGVAAVGAWAACPNQPITSNCAVWVGTRAQEQAMIDLQRAIKDRFGIPCEAVAGHGEVQPGSRNEVEGAALAKQIRGAC